MGYSELSTYVQWNEGKQVDTCVDTFCIISGIWLLFTNRKAKSRMQAVGFEPTNPEEWCLKPPRLTTSLHLRLPCGTEKFAKTELTTESFMQNLLFITSFFFLWRFGGSITLGFYQTPPSLAPCFFRRMMDSFVQIGWWHSALVPMNSLHELANDGRGKHCSFLDWSRLISAGIIWDCDA